MSTTIRLASHDVLAGRFPPPLGSAEPEIPSTLGELRQLAMDYDEPFLEHLEDSVGVDWVHGEVPDEVTGKLCTLHQPQWTQRHGTQWYYGYLVAFWSDSSDHPDMRSARLQVGWVIS